MLLFLMSRPIPILQRTSAEVYYWLDECRAINGAQFTHRNTVGYKKFLFNYLQNNINKFFLQAVSISHVIF